MLYEVITIAVAEGGKGLGQRCRWGHAGIANQHRDDADATVQGGEDLQAHEIVRLIQPPAGVVAALQPLVITSYSIHYTKLYESLGGAGCSGDFCGVVLLVGFGVSYNFV